MKKPYLLFLGSEKSLEDAKTASGIAFWRPDSCVGQLVLEDGTVDLGLTNLDIDGAILAGAKTLVLGAAPVGGVIAESWLPIIVEALEKGLDVASGLHQRLQDNPIIVDAATRCNRQLFDVRQPKQAFDVGTGEPRIGKRLLTVGTDCAVGKMFATLAIEKEMKSRGLNADFRATGQTGIFIAGSGVSIDAVVSDFVSGVAEALSPENTADHWDLIEGQGSLYHPSYAAVTLGLVHGSQPDKLVLCHEANREFILDVNNYPIPDISTCMETYLAAARLTNPEVSFAGICVNTKRLAEQEALDYLHTLSEKYQLPCCDPVRTGVSAIVDALTEAVE